jgi:transposase
MLRNSATTWSCPITFFHPTSEPGGRTWNSRQPKKLLVRFDLDTLQFAQKQVEKIEECLKQKNIQDERIPLLIQLPGVAMLTTTRILAAIGDIPRFESPKALAGYSGLTPGVEQSGVKLRGKGITKQGRRELRWVMVEVAWWAVKADPHWKKYFEELKRRMHPNQANVTIARHLLTMVWYALTRHEPYSHYLPERIAYKDPTWEHFHNRLLVFGKFSITFIVPP